MILHRTDGLRGLEVKLIIGLASAAVLRRRLTYAYVRLARTRAHVVAAVVVAVASSGV